MRSQRGQQRNIKVQTYTSWWVEAAVLDTPVLLLPSAPAPSVEAAVASFVTSIDSAPLDAVFPAAAPAVVEAPV